MLRSLGITPRSLASSTVRVFPCNAMRRYHLSLLSCRTYIQGYQALPSFVAPICFDPSCQSHADSTFLVVVGAPMLVMSIGLTYLFLSAVSKGQLTDKADGVKDEESPDALYRVVSYTPLPVVADSPGLRVKIDVGRIGSLKPKVFVFPCPPTSDLVVVTLPRPLGVVLEWDSLRRRAVVTEFVRGSNAYQRSKIGSLGPPSAGSGETVQQGDMVRATTTTNFVYPTKALFGASPPERHIVLYGADNQSFGNLCIALRKGEARDGPVTLVLERPKKFRRGG